MLYLGLGGLELNTPDSKDMTRYDVGQQVCDQISLMLKLITYMQ